nr:aminotransferase class I/II-fold pyridoxal phosphate-dependent enzyme [Peptoniphilus sp.]
MRRPLYERLTSLRGGVNFAMPGHKNRVEFDFSAADDITEFTGADNLLDPKDCLLEAQREIAAAYGVAQSVIVPAGSTTGIKIALYLATSPGDTLLIQRNAHISLFHAAVELDLDFEYIECAADPSNGLYRGLDPAELVRALDAHPEVRGVFLTSPDYFGGILRLKEIAEIVHARGKVLIVDEAHGAHLAFSSLASVSAVNFADYTVQSLHKTAPALTGAALLHMRRREERARLLKGMRLFMSTSPSYLVMASSEYAVANMARDWDEARVVRMRKQLIERVFAIKVVENRGEGFAAEDPVKFLFRIPGWRGEDVVSALAEKGIYLEMGDAHYALAILSPYHTDEDVSKLAEALNRLTPRDEDIVFHGGAYPAEEKVLRPREAFFKETESVALSNAAGRIAAENITPYPPGIPIVIYGERVTEGILKRIEENRDAIGIEDGEIAVVKEEL